MKNPFDRKYKTLAGVKFGIFLKRIYDYIELKLNGERILQQDYGINITLNFWPHVKRYEIINLVLTQSMIDNMSDLMKQDINAEIEKELNK